MPRPLPVGLAGRIHRLDRLVLAYHPPPILASRARRAVESWPLAHIRSSPPLGSKYRRSCRPRRGGDRITSTLPAVFVNAGPDSILDFTFESGLVLQAIIARQT